MTTKRHFTGEQAKEIGEKLGIDWIKFDVEQFRVGMDVELERGKQKSFTEKNRKKSEKRGFKNFN
jgi:hypothetical protein